MSPPSAKHAPPKLPLRLSFTVAINGQSQVFPENGPPPSFAVTPGEDLRINVDVTVPAHHEVTALWLGISGGVMGTPTCIRSWRMPASRSAPDRTGSGASGAGPGPGGPGFHRIITLGELVTPEYDGLPVPAGWRKPCLKDLLTCPMTQIIQLAQASKLP
jgi:hypothetical protein